MNNRWPYIRRLIIGASLSCFLCLLFGYGLKKPEAQEKNGRQSIYQKFRNNDSVTRAVRDRENELWRVTLKNPTDLEKIKELGTVVESYGPIVVVAKNKNKDLSVYSELELQRIPTEINLPAGKFDPVQDPPSAPLQSTDPKDIDRPDYYVVQLAGLARDEWIESFREVGAEVIQYVPHQAFFVYADGEAVRKIAAHSRVRWVGRYGSKHKITPELENFAKKPENERSLFEIAVFSRADLAEIRGQIKQTVSGKILAEQKLRNNYFSTLRVELTPAEVERIAKIRDVIRIDPYIKPVPEDERAAQIVAGNYTGKTSLMGPGYDPLTQFGVDGTNVTVAVSDDGVSIPGNGGFYITAANTVDGPLRGATAGADGGHGHINASIIAGGTPFGVMDPTGHNYGRGVAPNAHIINIPFLKSGNTTTDEQSVDDTVMTAGPNGVRGTIINNSWGSGTNGNAYDSRAAMWDGFVRDASIGSTIDPITVVFSAGNSGNSGLTRPKMAKNVIAVGNSENIRTELGGINADNIDDMRGSSSRGPAADGRIKPDITAPGTYITGSRAGSGSTVTDQIDANHSYSIGTSHAAPQIAGVAALFTQYWKNNNSGVNPSPALIKAAIINTGQEMDGVGSSDPLPNGDEGWGRVNLKFMLNTGVPMKYIDQNVEFSDTGSSFVANGYVADPTKPVRISLVWSDPPGVTDPALVNDLDLRVTVGGDVYRGNNFSNGNSVVGGSADTINNVENVFLPAGIPAGTGLTIEITASSINGDGILGNGDSTDQHFALVGYNYTEQAQTENIPFDFDGDSKTDLSVFRPGPGEWWYLQSSNNQNRAFRFGQGTDRIAPADYTGDGKTDIAFYRPATGEWFVLRSNDFSFYSFPLGSPGDIPVPADYDGDGRADPAVFRPTDATWYILNSGGGVTIRQFGTTGDLPVPADYDGDNQTDIGIFRPDSGQWWISRSQAGLLALTFGTETDNTLPADYTGDGAADIAFFRPATNEWFVLRSEDLSFYAIPFGVDGDLPVPGDYDGDGRADPAVFRPTLNTWYLEQSTNGFRAVSFGAPDDRPVPGAFIN